LLDVSCFLARLDHLGSRRYERRAVPVADSVLGAANQEGD
jgi:hypothetical protein